MKVKRVKTATGSHIEPPCSSAWPESKKLEWKVAVVEADSGLQVRIDPSGHAVRSFGVWVPTRARYSISLPGSSSGPFTFHDAWTYLNGLETGFRAGKAVAG